jgi:hypothetical protein
MSNDFETITRFLNRYGDDVEGRELDEIPAQLKPKFRDFALGTLKESDRKELAMMLKEHPHWVTFLAEEARAARGGDQPNP